MRLEGTISGGGKSAIAVIPSGGIGSIRPRTEHGCVLRARMLGPQLYDKGPSAAISKPGEDAIVSNYVEFTLEAGTLALWRQSECAEYGLDLARGAANDRVLIELEVADVEREYARLKGLQVEWVQELTTQPWGHRAFYIRDPDGNVLNLHMVVEE